MKVGKIVFSNNLHPQFDFVKDFCSAPLTEREETFMLLIKSINSIIKGWEDGDYGTIQEVLKNVEAWRVEVKKNGVEI